MECQYCGSIKTTEQPDRKDPGYSRFRYLDCGRSYNKRTGRPFKMLQTPTDIICLVVL